LRRNDRLMDGHGQQYFDFDEGTTQRSALSIPTYSRLDEVGPLFDQAIEFEDADCFEEAATVYERAVKLEPGDPALHFNLGNVLYSLRHLDRSVDSFREAVRIDPHYAEAWNNLGNALADAEQLDEGIRALQRAVQLVPNYADAHFNLADILKRVGRTQESAQHWQAYQQHSAPSRLAARNSSRLQVYRDEPAG
jgi:tetratricopeptide (TPR) repeat protein